MVHMRFKFLLPIFAAIGLLMGFSHADGSQGLIDSADATAVSSQDHGTVDDVIETIENLAAEGDITNATVSRALVTHLTALAHFLNKAQYQKAVKHMDGFQVLLDHYQQRGMITAEAAQSLAIPAQQLRAQWNAIFDSNRVMSTLWDLSVGIGPRVAGQAGEKAAANYLRDTFESFGYTASIQEFAIRDALKMELTVGNQNFALGSASGAAETGENGVTGVLYDAGLGLETDFSEDASGSIVLVERGEIPYWDKVHNAMNAGAIGVIVYDSAESLMPVRPSLGNNRSTIPVVGIQKADGEALLAQMADGDVEANLYVRTQRNQTSQNVIGVKKPKHIANPEIVYISAHYDSVPFSPGANDDGSGTATLVEIARTMQDLDTDKEIRFIAFGAEEIGLVGSNYYVNNLPQSDLNRSIINFQFEMLGSAFEEGSYMAVNTVDGSKNVIWNYTEAAFDTLGHDKEKLILFRRGSSDHVPFHNKGIPAAAFNMGTKAGGLEPEYHTSHDSFDKISQERLQFAGNIIKHAIFDYLADHQSNQADAELDEAS